MTTPRLTKVAALAALLAAAAPAAATQEYIVPFNAPAAGAYQSYRINAIGGPFEQLWLEGRKIEAASYYDGQGGTFDYWAQLPFLCTTAGSCDLITMRHASFTPDSFSFMLYGPPLPYDNCNPALSIPRNYGRQCSSWQGISSIRYDALVGDGATVTLDYLGGGTVPEPEAWALLIAGFALTGAALRRRRTMAA